MYRLWIVSVPPVVLYCAVNVVLPGVKPVSRNVALDFTNWFPCWFSANVSLAADAFAPLTTNPIYPALPLLLTMPAVTEISTMPEAGTTTVIAGPTVAKSV
jgi:hypothetical protein